MPTNIKRFSSKQVKETLVQWTIAHSGYEDRSYLGMSRIGECPRVLYVDFMNIRRDWDVAHHLMCYAGYLWESDIKTRLRSAGLYAALSERQLVAAFDDRFRGHIDGELVDGSLLEIKSVTQAKIDAIRSTQRIPLKNYQQVQVYLRHGEYDRALVVYVARDTDELFVYEVTPNRGVQDILDEKARQILAAIDAGTLPRCDCGRCQLLPPSLKGEGRDGV
jgi:hypothetical protein